MSRDIVDTFEEVARRRWRRTWSREGARKGDPRPESGRPLEGRKGSKHKIMSTRRVLQPPANSTSFLLPNMVLASLTESEARSLRTSEERHSGPLDPLEFSENPA
jgi:hypothetical protein